MKEGYILLHRKMLDNPLLNIKPFCKGYAWVVLLELTNHKTSYITVKNGVTIQINRGECGYSEKALAEIYGWSRSKVRRYLEQLKSEKMIQQKIVENHSVIRVLNFDQYQKKQQTIQQKDNKRDNKRTQIKNEKEERDSKLSLSIEEREILKNFLSRKKGKGKVENIEAYLDTIIKNGSYLPILEKEKARLERLKQEEVIPPPENFEEDEPPLSAQELQEMMRSKLVFFASSRSAKLPAETTGCPQDCSAGTEARLTRAQLSRKEM